MIKKGFTLAEVLVTLGIIGVVAALTIPTLQASVQRQKIGPALAKAINTLQNANKLILVKNDASSLYSICGEHYPTCLSKVTSGSLIDDNTFISKDGIQFKQIEGEQEYAPILTEKYFGKAYRIEIDIDGDSKGKNEYAKDLFSVMVDYYGDVIAEGSAKEKDYMGEKATDDWHDWSAVCPNDSTPSSGQERYCTGAIVDNGYKVMYKL
jgi:prepilin-type N-terminal cleavage/methylation domain-containing protein